MASSFSLHNFHPFFIFFLLLPFQQTADSCYNSIFNFGDSISDTGNFLLSAGDDCLAGHPPYGQTFFGHPTGRFSDGRLIIDFIAEAMGIPFLVPFLGGADGGVSGDFRQGINFAVAGATALNNDFFIKRGLDVTWTNMSLGVQMGLFKQLFSFCDSGCKDLFNKSLFMVGEIGGNDYNVAFFQNYPLAEIKSFVPEVINTIAMAIEDLISIGAKTLLVPGNFPIGCIPIYLTLFENSKSEDYEANTGCIKWLNEFSEYHNNYLKQELHRLHFIHPNITIIYADYFNAILNFIKPSNNTKLKRISLVSCCGGGGQYNYNDSAKCGTKTSTVCDDPSTCLSWDGKHLTEAAYKSMVKGFLEGPFADPSLNKACSSFVTFNVSKVEYGEKICVDI